MMMVVFYRTKRKQDTPYKRLSVPIFEKTGFEKARILCVPYTELASRRWLSE